MQCNRKYNTVKHNFCLFLQTESFLCQSTKIDWPGTSLKKKKSIACLSSHVQWGEVLFQDWCLDSSFTTHPISHSLLMLFSLIRAGGVGRGQEDRFCSGPVYSPDGCQIGRRLYLRYLRSGCHQKSSVWRESWHHHLRDWQRPGVWVYGFVMKSVGEILNGTNLPKLSDAHEDTCSRGRGRWARHRIQISVCL